MKSNETLNLIEEITRNDGSKYYEVSDIAQNGRAELAAIRGFIKSVRILQLILTILRNGNEHPKWRKSLRIFCVKIILRKNSNFILDRWR